MAISETTSTNGGQVTLTSAQHYAALNVGTGNLVTSATFNAGVNYVIDFSQATSSGITATNNTGSDDFITINTTGTYEINYGTCFFSQASATVGFFIQKNGTDIAELKKSTWSVLNESVCVAGSNIVSLSSGDVLKMVANSGLTQTACSFYSPYLTVKRLN